MSSKLGTSVTLMMEPVMCLSVAGGLEFRVAGKTPTSLMQWQVGTPQEREQSYG